MVVRVSGLLYIDINPTPNGFCLQLCLFLALRGSRDDLDHVNLTTHGGPSTPLSYVLPGLRPIRLHTTDFTKAACGGSI